MNTIIREKRKEIGLTQEQIADYLGVSTPAVSKWESGVTYPDISLLSPLARLLKIDMNTLLCFNERLSQQEIEHFCKEVTDMIRKSGFESGFAIGLEKIREYPNCIGLIFSIALASEGALFMSGINASDKEKYDDQIIALYERVVKSDDEQFRSGAIFMLASKYIGYEEYDKAQEMLDLLPEKTAVDKTQLQANLWIKQNRLAEAAQLLESKLWLMGINEIPIILMNLADIALKEGSEENASHIAALSRKASKLFELWDYYSFVAPLQIALAQKNVTDSISFLRSMLAAALMPWETKKTTLYPHMTININRENVSAHMLPALLSELENNPKYAFLHSSEEFQQLIKQYRAPL